MRPKPVPAPRRDEAAAGGGGAGSTAEEDEIRLPSMASGLSSSDQDRLEEALEGGPRLAGRAGGGMDDMMEGGVGGAPDKRGLDDAGVDRWAVPFAMDFSHLNRMELQTRLFQAVRTGSTAAVEALVAAGARVHAVLGNLARGFNGLFVAATLGHASTTERLCRYGCNVTAVTSYRLTPLHMAASSATGDPDTVQVLVEFGADIEARDRFGCTPAMHAAASGHMGALVRLLELGAAYHVLTPDGLSLDQLAESNGFNLTARAIRAAPQDLRQGKPVRQFRRRRPSSPKPRHDSEDGDVENLDVAVGSRGDSEALDGEDIRRLAPKRPLFSDEDKVATEMTALLERVARDGAPAGLMKPREESAEEEEGGERAPESEATGGERVPESEAMGAERQGGGGWEALATG